MPRAFETCCFLKASFSLLHVAQNNHHCGRSCLPIKRVDANVKTINARMRVCMNGVKTIAYNDRRNEMER